MRDRGGTDRRKCEETAAGQTGVDGGNSAAGDILEWRRQRRDRRECGGNMEATGAGQARELRREGTAAGQAGGSGGDSGVTDGSVEATSAGGRIVLHYSPPIYERWFPSPAYRACGWGAAPSPPSGAGGRPPLLSSTSLSHGAATSPGLGLSGRARRQSTREGGAQWGGGERRESARPNINHKKPPQQQVVVSPWGVRV